MKHYVCEVIQISARSVGFVGLIVSVLVLTEKDCETLLPIVFHPWREGKGASIEGYALSFGRLSTLRPLGFYTQGVYFCYLINSVN